MIGSFIVLGGECYVQTNDSGTLQKMGKLPWYQVIRFAFKNAFKGHVEVSEVLEAVKQREAKHAKRRRRSFV